MRPSQVLLPASVLAGAAAIIAAASSAWLASSTCGVVALATLAGYVWVAGREAAPRVRWALVAGLALLAAAQALRVVWYREPEADFGWFAYGPISEVPGVLEPWRRTLDQERFAAVAVLLGVAGLAVAVLALPRCRWSGRAVLTTGIVVLLLALLGTRVRTVFDEAPALDLLAVLWPPLLAAVVAAAAAVLAGRRRDPAWLVAAGSLLLALAAVNTLDDLAGNWWLWWTLSGRDTDPAFTAVGLATALSPRAYAAAQTAVALGGPILLAVGALRALGPPADGRDQRLRPG